MSDELSNGPGFGAAWWVAVPLSGVAAGALTYLFVPFLPLLFGALAAIFVGAILLVARAQAVAAVGFHLQALDAAIGAGRTDRTEPNGDAVVEWPQPGIQAHGKPRVLGGSSVRIEAGQTVRTIDVSHGSKGVDDIHEAVEVADAALDEASAPVEPQRAWDGRVPDGRGTQLVGRAFGVAVPAALVFGNFVFGSYLVGVPIGIAVGLAAYALGAKRGRRMSQAARGVLERAGEEGLEVGPARLVGDAMQPRWVARTSSGVLVVDGTSGWNSLEVQLDTEGRRLGPASAPIDAPGLAFDRVTGRAAGA